MVNKCLSRTKTLHACHVPVTVISFHLHQNPQTRDLNLISRMRQLRFTAGRPCPGHPANRWQSQDQNPGPPGSKECCHRRAFPKWGARGPVTSAEWIPWERRMAMGGGPWVWGEKGSGSGSSQPPNSVLSLPRHGWCGHASLSLPLHLGQPPWVLAEKKIRIGV